MLKYGDLEDTCQGNASTLHVDLVLTALEGVSLKLVTVGDEFGVIFRIHDVDYLTTYDFADSWSCQGAEHVAVFIDGALAFGTPPEG